MARWTPRDAAWLVGRYMFEAAALPAAWAQHCAKLDEVWVPSAWQADAFAASGVDRAKLVVMPEALDVFHYDPSDLVRALFACFSSTSFFLFFYFRFFVFRLLSRFRAGQKKSWGELLCFCFFYF